MQSGVFVDEYSSSELQTFLDNDNIPTSIQNEWSAESFDPEYSIVATWQNVTYSTQTVDEVGFSTIFEN